MKNNIKIYSIIVSILFISLQCKKDSESTISDAEKTQALKNVTLKYDSASYILGLPDGALSGKSFEQLKLEDSAKYTNPENYSVIIGSNFTADNTKDGSSDAKFDGMELNQVMDTIKSAPIKSSTGPFDVKKKSTLPVSTNTKINLKTHRTTGLYIFQQIVNGQNLATTFSPILKYKIGNLAGNIPLPDVKQNIPTRASDQTKEFLRGLINSGVFAQKP